MPLGIGNNLIRNGGGLNPDGLALDLQFATDKTLTARRGPTPVLTRGTSATFVNSAGLIEYAPENLLQRSEEFDNTYWTPTRAPQPTANAAVSPDGTTTADKLIADTTAANNHRVDRSPVTLALNTIYTVSVFAKASEYTGIALGVGLSATQGVNYSLVGAGTATPVSGAGHTGTIQQLSNGWYRCTATFTSDAATATHRVAIYVGQNGTTFTYTGDNTSGIFIWGAQLEVGSSAKTYNRTTTAAFYGPRFDHDPVSPFACRGLLIEEGRTNLLQYSEIFNEAASSNYWDSATANAVTSDQTTSPDGAVTADLLTTSTTAFDCFVRRTINWVGSTQYSYSIFLKRGPSNHRYVGLYIGAGITGALQYPYFDFDNPTTVQIPSGTMVGTINSTRVDAYPNGWYRVSVTFTTAATPVTIYGGVYVATSNGTLPNTSTAGLDCYIWGIQAETGAFPTSYIPTTTSALARAADTCSIANTSSFWNGSEFTVFTNANWAAAGFDSYASNFSITSGFFGIRRPNTNLATGIIRSSGVNADISFGTSGSFTTGSMRMALAHSTGQQAGSLNGATAIQQNSAFVPSSNPPLNIGYSGTGAYINGHVLAIRYYKKRLPNAKLQALTV